MSNRIVLGAFDGTFVLRVSRPGYNVLDTSLAQDGIAFDSRWIANTKPWISGVATSFGTGSAASFTVALGYTVTTADPPILVHFWRRSGASGWDANCWETGGLNSADVGATDLVIGQLSTSGAPAAWARCVYMILRYTKI
jgi:hypothetical protein